MPELPEVETVRRGLARHLLGRTVARTVVLREYSVRGQAGGAEELAARLAGRVFTAAVRRGKFCWLVMDDGQLLLAHLGMSGQLLVSGPDDAGVDPTHLRVAITMADGGRLLFVDQRTFGYLRVCEAVPTADGLPGGVGSDLAALPAPAAHIARDLLDEHLDRAALVAAMRRRRTEVKRALLDQSMVSGIGNIYADEGLWRSRTHYAHPTAGLTAARAATVLDAVALVMTEALAAGGTSFDSLYVNVNGASGYFDRSLAVYGRCGQACRRCGTPVRRDAFMNRSSFTCPTCQRRPRGVPG